jgi:hypothetical protein
LGIFQHKIKKKFYMLNRTQPKLGIRGWIKCSGGGRCFQTEPPYYLKHQPGNPWLGTKHDGVSVEYGRGFEFKPIHHLYRFRWNFNHRGYHTLWTRNPGGKTPHWLEVSYWNKLKPHLFNYEVLPHTILACVVSCIVIWNLSRYIFFHPDLTIYNVIFFTMRKYVNVLRNQEIPTLDTPVFRWFQAAPEFYGYNPHREMIALGVLANDPYVEYMKAIGRDKELLIKPPFGMGEAAPGKVKIYVPKSKPDDKVKWTDPAKPVKHWYVGPHGTGPHSSHGHGDHDHDEHGHHGDDHGHHHHGDDHSHGHKDDHGKKGGHH